MNISTVENSGALCLAGCLEIYDAEALRAAILEVFASRPKLVVNLGGLEHCDAAGAQVLWSAAATAAKLGRTIDFENVTPSLVESWTSLGFCADFFSPQHS